MPEPPAPPSERAPLKESFEPQRSEPLLREAADCTPAPVWMTNRDGAMVFANRAFEESAGVPLDQLMGNGWVQFLHPDDVPAAREKRAAAWANNHAAYTYEARFRRADGAWRWWEVSSRPRYDASGDFDGYVGMAIDTTDTRAAREALEESERRYRELVAGLTDAIVWEGDPATFRFTFVSGAAETLLGYPASRWVEEPAFWVDHMHPDDRAWAVDYCAKHTEAGVNHEFEYRMIAADGRTVWLRDNVYLSEKDGKKVSRGLMVDITARKQAEETLRASEARYRAVVETQAELVCRFKSDGTILFANGAYAKSVGATAEQLSGANLWAWVSKEDRSAVEDLLAMLTPERPEVRIENRFETSQGERWMLWANRAIAFDQNGRWTEAQSTGVDIHDRKLAEEHTKLLLDELNHRVKNTLAVVQGIAQQTFKQVDPEARRAFEGRLAALSGAHSLLTESRWTPASLEAVVDEVTHVCGAARTRIDAGGEPVMLAPRQALSISMALHELCTNAMKYGALSTESGKVDLHWRVDDGAPAGLHIVWRERDGPPVAKPQERGYGSMMIERALAHDLQGSAKLDFQREGLVCTIDAPLEN